MEQTKICSCCNIEKPLSEFFKAKSGKFGVRSDCKVCKVKKRREWLHSHEDKGRLVRKKHRLSSVYNIPLEEYLTMLKSQNNLCAICGNPEKRNTSSDNKPTMDLAVDHCHSTGKIRGLLCASCNTAIGLLKEDPAIFKQALNYLEKSKNDN